MTKVKETVVTLIRASCGKPLPHPDAIRCAYVRAAIEHFRGNLSKTGRSLGIPRRTLQRMLKKNPDRRHGDAEKCDGNCQACLESKLIRERDATLTV